ncbi:hypothetical protein E4K64_08000 [Bradyrhizobium frederickii]|uniref:Sodium:proton antiporter n=1 Tax=Bradyrhizobium frederickii TaxID=2560054 RepID=A0A4Y9PFI5_9BRAD|nr:hypothetical protein [Bradyrhizobium frederickii]TFV77776.1 hypothetical protein E4K64_08000 [Bradyrhizobium frederickii]
MQMPAITPDLLAVLALLCAVAALHMIRLWRSGQVIFNGGILLALGLAIACALPVLSHLPWAEIAAEVSDQATAAIQLLHAAYVILTL